MHFHILADVPFTPQAVLSAIWDDLTDAPVVNVRRVRTQRRDGELTHSCGESTTQSNSLNTRRALPQLRTSRS